MKTIALLAAFVLSACSASAVLVCPPCDAWPACGGPACVTGTDAGNTVEPDGDAYPTDGGRPARDR